MIGTNFLAYALANIPPYPKLSRSKGLSRRIFSRASIWAGITTLILLAMFAKPALTEEADSQADTLVSSQVVSDSIPAAPAAATNVRAKDKPNDGGGAIIIEWDLSPDENGLEGVQGYTVFRSIFADGPFSEVGNAVRGASKITDNKATNGEMFYYRVDAYNVYFDLEGERQTVSTSSMLSTSVASSAQWFHWARLVCLVLVLFISASIMFFIYRAKSGKELYIRKIAGIDAVDEAVGRATEMGKKVFFIPGIQDMNDVQTIAGIAILGRVAELAAEYETWLEVPVSKSLVMVTARETMKEAYTKVGRPEAYQEAQVHYLTDDQFGYAAAIDGMVVREKPATIFYMGAFFAESLILAETGNAAGAIQIAGTAMPSQLPFFVASCDYTLIGEELFAASAYLSREPRQLGSLKGQDVGKALFLTAIILGILIELITKAQVSHYFHVG